MMSKLPDRVLGIMSGSSLDGYDLAICDFQEDGELEFNLIWSHFEPMSERMKSQLRLFHNLKPKALFQLELDFTRDLVSSLKSIPADLSDSIDYISCHGHTILHFPEEGFSTQLLNGGVMAGLSGYPVICDFRNTDIALGGTGTPLAPLADKYLFGDYSFALNLGGIANITFHKEDRVVAFDVCPCNQVLNHISERLGTPYDDKGHFAREGNVVQELMTRLNDLDYLHFPYPKSLDNNWIREKVISFFEDSYDARDLLRTAVEWTSFWIAEAIKRLISENERKDHTYSCLCTGGGSKNDFLIERIDYYLKYDNININLIIPNSAIVDYKEAILMALMGYFRKNNKNNIWSSVTGARMDSIGGAIYQGVNQSI